MVLRGARTEYRTAGFIKRRVVPVPVLEGTVIAAEVIDRELEGGSESIRVSETIQRDKAYRNRLSLNVTLSQ